MWELQKENRGLCCIFDMIPALELLTDEQRGRLLMGLIRYANGGPDPEEELDIQTKIMWIVMKSGVDRDDEKYNKKVENARRSVEKRAIKRKLINDILAESGELTTEVRRNLRRLAEADEDEAAEAGEETEPKRNRKPEVREEDKAMDFETMRRQRIRMLEESGR